MLNFIKNFRNDEDGAVTVDWVVLTAAIVLLGVFIGNSIGTQTEELATRVATEMQTMGDFTTP